MIQAGHRLLGGNIRRLLEQEKMGKSVFLPNYTLKIYDEQGMIFYSKSLKRQMKSVGNKYGLTLVADRTGE